MTGGLPSASRIERQTDFIEPVKIDSEITESLQMYTYVNTHTHLSCAMQVLTYLFLCTAGLELVLF